jgi:hypothetical protein
LFSNFENPQKFTCHLKADSQFGSTSFDLNVTPELVQKALSQEIVVSGDKDVNEGDNANLDCQPGENC